MSRGKGWMIACMMLALAALGLAGGQTAHAEAITYEDGQYQVPFQVLKDTSDEISATSDYVDGTAEIHIEHGKIQALLTLKNSSWWQEFKVQSHAGQAYNDVVTVSEDADRQTRVVTFPIDDLSRSINGKIHIIVTGIPGFEYDHQYDIRLKFDASGIPVSTKPAASESSEANAAPVTTPSAKPEASSPSAQETPAKPAEAADRSESTQDRQAQASEPQKQTETADQGASPAGNGGEAAAATEADAADPGQESGDAIEEEAPSADEAGDLPDGEEPLAPADAAEESEPAAGSAPWILIAIGALLVIVAAVAATIWFRRPRKAS